MRIVNFNGFFSSYPSFFQQAFGLVRLVRIQLVQVNSVRHTGREYTHQRLGAAMERHLGDLARSRPNPPTARRARTSSKGFTRMFRKDTVGDISGPVMMVIPGLFSSNSACWIGTRTMKSTSPDRSEALAVRESFIMRNSNVSRYGSPLW
jgi:hypothetical protein